MNKVELIARIVERFAGHPIIFTTGYASRIAFELAPASTNHFYMVGSMGMASAVARGVASRTGSGCRFPVVVDGDGAVLMGIHALLLEQETGGEILHIVANDFIYASTGGQQTPTSISSICALALGAGYGLATEIPLQAESFDDSLQDAIVMVERGKSALLNCIVDTGPKPFGRIEAPLPDITRQFRTFIEHQPRSLFSPRQSKPGA